jgi:hypothetical protein
VGALADAATTAIGTKFGVPVAYLPRASDFVDKASDAIGFTDPKVQPRNFNERLALDGTRFLAGSIVPVGGVTGKGYRLARAVEEGVPQASRLVRAAISTAKHPVRTGASVVGAAGGSISLGELAERYGVPRPAGEFAGALVGGGVVASIPRAGRYVRQTLGRSPEPGLSPYSRPPAVSPHSDAAKPVDYPQGRNSNGQGSTRARPSPPVGHAKAGPGSVPPAVPSLERQRRAIRQAGHSGLLGGSRSAAHAPAIAPDGTALPRYGIDLRPQAVREAEEVARRVEQQKAVYDAPLWDEAFANLRYDLPQHIRHRFGEEFVSSLALDPPSKLAFQRLAWPTLTPAAVNRSITGPELIGLSQSYRPDQLFSSMSPLSPAFLTATGNIQDVLETVAKQHPGQLARIRELEARTIPDSQLLLPRLGRSVPQVTGRPGEFSIIDLPDYPDEHVWRPDGVYRLNTGDEYRVDLRSKDNSNRQDRNALGFDGSLFHIHDVKPVMLGGSPVDVTNKILLRNTDHLGELTPYWARIYREIKRIANWEEY